MKFNVQILILGLIWNLCQSRNYEYELSRAKKQWQGAQRAVHFKDSHLLLSTKLNKVMGYFSTFAPLISGKVWSLNFTIELQGQSNSSKDGFAFLASAQQLNMYTLSEKNYPKKSFHKMIPQIPGFFLFINGADKDNSLWFGYQQSGKAIKKDFIQKCELASRFSQDKIYIYLQAREGQIHVSYHMGSDETGYKECGTVYVPTKDLLNFYPVLFARSQKESKFAIRVSQMTLQTELPNSSISLFENQQNENVPKLFQEISFVKNNSHQVQVQGTDISVDGKLDLYKIYQLQNKIYRIVDFSNEKLAQCLSQTQSFYDFSQMQKKNYLKLGNNVIKTVNAWVTQSHSQFDQMNNDINQLKKSLKSYDVEKILDKTQKVMDLLTEKVLGKDSVLKQYKKFAKLIQRNIKNLKFGKQNSLKQANIMTRFISNQTKMSIEQVQNKLNISVLIMGIIILVVLVVVYVKLGSTSKEIL